MRQPTGRTVGTVRVLHFPGGWQTVTGKRIGVRIIYMHDSGRNRRNLTDWCAEHGLVARCVQTDRQAGDTDEPSQPVSPPPVNTDNRQWPRWAAYEVSGLPLDLDELCGRPFVREWHYAIDAGVPRPQRMDPLAPARHPAAKLARMDKGERAAADQRETYAAEIAADVRKGQTRAAAFAIALRRAAAGK